MKILITRPEPGASSTAERLAAMGHEPILAPCLTVEPRRAKLPVRPAAIILTSSQAIPLLPARYWDVTVFCVGDATAGRLAEAGFTDVHSAHGDALDLFRIVATRRLPGLHLLAVGERHGLALAKQLRDCGIPVMRRAVYAAHPAYDLPAAVRQALTAGEVGAALFYSAETARVFTGLDPENVGGVQAYALSQAVAEPLKRLPWAAIHVALAPNEADLLSMLAETP